MKDKRGFSMIELLATVTIIGILSVIAIGSVHYLLEKGRENYYNTQRNNLVSAAKAYFRVNKDLLPKQDGLSTEVSLEQLQGSKLIGKLYDAKKNECKKKVSGGDVIDSKVIVYRVSKNNYKYTAYLYCPNQIDSTLYTEGDFSFSIKDINKTGTAFTLTIESITTNIKSYTYTVLKNGMTYIGPITDKVNGKVVTLKPFTISAEEYYQNNTFSISIMAVDSNGKTGNVTTSIYLKDNQAPTITYLGSDTTEWKLPGTQKFDFSCEDKLDPSKPADSQYVSGCQKDHYTITLNATNFKKDEFKVVKFYDKAGNKFEFDLRPYIRLDNEPPSKPTVKAYVKDSSTNLTPSTNPGNLATYTSNTWIKKWFYMEGFGSIDKGFGEIGQGADNIYYELKIDDDDYAKINNVTFNDKLYVYRNVNVEGTSIVKVRVCDKIQNCSDPITYTIKLDRTAPNAPTVKGYVKTSATDLNPSTKGNLTEHASNKWLSGRVYTEGTGSSDPDFGTHGAGVGGVFYQFKLTGESDFSKRNNYTYNNKLYVYRNVNAEGITSVTFRSCDALDNCSSGVEYIAKLDRTAPTVPTVTGYSKDDDTNLKPDTRGTLSTHPSNTWLSGYIYTEATGSVDNGSAANVTPSDGLYYKYKIDSGDYEKRTVTHNNKKYSYRNFKDQGVRTVYYSACDLVNNCSSAASYVVKLDRKKPSKPTLYTYIKTSNTDLKPSTKGSLDEYTSNTWISAYVYAQVTDSVDEGSSAGVTPSDNIYYQYKIDSGSYSNTHSETYRGKLYGYNNIEKQDDRTVKYRSCDQAGNCSDEVSVRVKLDRKKPEVPSVVGYIKSSTTDITPSTHTTSLTKHSSDKWLSGYLYLEASSIDNPYEDDRTASGMDYFMRKVSGDDDYEKKTGSRDSVKYGFKNLEKQGKRTVYFKACDHAGNCSSSASYIAKLDRTAPDCDVTKSDTENTNGVTLKFDCDDKPTKIDGVSVENSGIKSGTCPSTQKKQKSSWSSTLEDNAGNSSTCSATVSHHTLYKRHYRDWVCTNEKTTYSCPSGYSLNSAHTICSKTVSYKTQSNCAAQCPSACVGYNAGYSDEVHYCYYSTSPTSSTSCTAHGWTAWGGWSTWTTTHYCSSSDENNGSCEDQSGVFYY